MKSITASETQPAPASSRGKVTNIILWALQILLAAAFVLAGSSKLFVSQPETIESFAKLGLGAWFRYFVGAVELAGALGLLIPRLSGLAALGLAGVMVGATLTHLFILPPWYFASFPAILVVVFSLIAWARREEIMSLFKKLARGPS